MHMILKMAPLLFLTMCTSCAGRGFQTPVATHDIVELWNNPLPRPDFVRSADKEPNELGQLCLSISEHEIWNPGDYGDDVGNAILYSMRFVVDGNNVREPFVTSLAIIIYVHDEDKNVVGSHGGGSSICSETDDLSEGLHLASVQFNSTAGVQYAYTWAFRITR